MSLLRAAAVLVLFSVGAAAHAAVRAALDNSQIGRSDTVQLTLTRDGQTDAQPDLAPLKQDFDVLSVSRSSNVQIIDGSMSSQTQAQIVLSPKHVGRLAIAPIAWGGETSPALTLTVSGAGGGKPAQGATPAGEVFLTTTVDQRNPYVQAAVSVAVSVYSSVELYQASLVFPASNDVLVQLDGGDQHHTEIRNGQQYDVVTRNYLMFPQKSGELRVAGAVLAGQIPVRLRNTPFSSDPFANFFGAANGTMTGTKPIRVRGHPIFLDVRPRPAAAGAGPWLPAANLRLTSRWQSDGQHVHAGDPISLDLHLQADGLTAAQLPDLSSMLSLPPGIKAYPDQAKLHNVFGAESVTGSRDQSIALIADRAGRVVVPALHLSWWDTKSDRAREVDLPAQRLDILPAVGAAAAAAALSAAPAAPRAPASAAARSALSPPAPALRGLRGSDGRWVLISAALGLLWLATLIAWRLSRLRTPSAIPAPDADAGRHNMAAGGRAAAAAALAQGRSNAPNAASAPVDAARARRQFHDACRRNDAPAAHRWLLAWAASAWPGPAPSGLTAFAKRLGDPQLDASLGALDRACYAGGAWNGAGLAEALKVLPRTHARAKANAAGIAPLYP